MAVNSILLDTTMAIKYKVGVDTKGNDVYRTQKASDLNLLATDENLLDLSDIVGSIIEHPISLVTKEETHLLSR